MSSDRYHKAAKDGLLEMLKETTRRDVNAKDVDGMTPVLWAAFEGRLDALRLLVGRGGDPDKSDQFGNTALHLSAAKGHMQCVDFLVKFGVNIYALDIDNHSAKDLAAINNRDDILRYLDIATGNLEATDKKRAKVLQEQAKKNSEKRAKEYMKKQQKLEMEAETEVRTMPHRPSTVLSAWKQKLWSGSQGTLKQPPNREIVTNTTKFSALVGGTLSGARGAVQKKAQASKARQLHQTDNDFKIGEMEENGTRSIRSIQGLRRDSEVLYVGTFNTAAGAPGKRGKIADVFEVDSNDEENSAEKRVKETYGTLSRSFSQPDFLLNNNPDDDDLREDVMMQRPSGLFDRPMMGSLAFPRSVTAALSHLAPEASSVGSNGTPNHNKAQRAKPRTYHAVSDSSDDENSSETDDQEDRSSPLQRFLAAWGLEEHFHIFQKQQIDLDTLMLLTESDLKSLGLPLGPFRKLDVAIQERKNALTNPGSIVDSKM